MQKILHFTWCFSTRSLDFTPGGRYTREVDAGAVLQTTPAVLRMNPLVGIKIVKKLTNRR